MSSHKLMVFDLDGTLFNTKPGIVGAIKKVVSEEGLKEIPEDVFDSFIGPPIDESFVRVYGVVKEEGKRLGTVFREYYGKDEYLFKTAEYPGMKDTLIKLKEKGIRLALATYKKEWMAKKICSHFGYDEYLDVIHGSDPEGRLTKMDIIKLCIDECDCEASEVLMIGDTYLDSEGAKGAGTDFLGVTYGFGFAGKEDVLRYEGAYAVDRPEEILDI